MNIVVLDITNRNADQYNPALCSALVKVLPSDSSVTLLSTNISEEPKGYSFKTLVRIVPNSMDSSRSPIKRFLRALEVIVNYFYVFIYLLINKPDVIHIQWLPFIDYNLIEKNILRAFKKTTNHLKIFLTVHNIYPHNIPNDKKGDYRRRFVVVDKYIDGYLVHLNSTRDQLAKEFCIDYNKINVAYHGVYVPDNIDKKCQHKKNGLVNFIMYGFQTKYKGADILIEAISLMPAEYRQRIHAIIVGKTDDQLYSQYAEKANSLEIEWINKFVPNDVLYSLIFNSDAILLPYREISQSGVLLLALSYHKPILTSDLPSFRETLEGYPSDYFFEANNSQALADALKRFIDGDFNAQLITEIIEGLNIKYSWANTAKATLKAYCGQ